jgi:pimeloyl-ACP methyl ester carboxylesterase
MTLKSSTITLRDGRKLAYAEHGDLSGKPVFFFHGNPGSRLMHHPDTSIAEALGARIISIDRPGYGGSDFQPGRKLLDWADDVAQLADALNIERFSVFGASAGGPYVAATAYKIPQRLNQVMIVSGAAPVNRENAFEGMNDVYLRAFKTSMRVPEWLVRFLVGFQRRAALKDLEKMITDSYAYITESDRQLLDKPDIRQQMKDYRREAYRQGAAGIAREVKILVTPWGFNLADIKPTVYLWYWEGDTIVPMQMGRYLAEHIPYTKTKFLSGGGHFSLYAHWREALEILLQD